MKPTKVQKTLMLNKTSSEAVGYDKHRTSVGLFGNHICEKYTDGWKYKPSHHSKDKVHVERINVLYLILANHYRRAPSMPAD